MNREIWIGLAEVIPLPGSTTLSRGAKGAFVNVLAWATSADVLRSRVKALMNEMGLHLAGLEDAEPFLLRTERCEVDDGLWEIAREMECEPNAVRFGTFHCWMKAE